MDVQEVTYYRLREELNVENLGYQRYKLTPRAGWLWLQKLCFKILDKLGCAELATNKYKTWARVKAQNDNTLKALMEQENTLAMIHYNNRDSYQIFMGPDNFAELMDMTKHGLHTFSFVGSSKTGHWDEENDRPDYRYHNIPITVVAWMKGVIIVPKTVK
jgi:hypothetical protein